MRINNAKLITHLERPTTCIIGDLVWDESKSEAWNARVYFIPLGSAETSKAWDDVARTSDGMYDSRINIREYAYAMLDHSRKMERERNAMKTEAVKYIQLWDKVTKELETLKFGPENVQAVAPATLDSALQKDVMAG